VVIAAEHSTLESPTGLPLHLGDIEWSEPGNGIWMQKSAVDSHHRRGIAITAAVGTRCRVEIEVEVTRAIPGAGKSPSDGVGRRNGAY
jgi:hypothetical protein